jgi:hypothetical protein
MSDGLREALAELADDFASNVDWSNGRSNYGDNEAWESAARQVRALLAERPATPAERCPTCGPGYRYGDDGCRHTPAEEVAEVAVGEREKCPNAPDGWCGCKASGGLCPVLVSPAEAVIAQVFVRDTGPRYALRYARTILASDWLRAHDAALTAKAKAEGRVEALREAADAIESGDVDHEELRRSGVDDLAPRGWSDRSVIAAHDSGSVWVDWLRLRANEEAT